MNDQSVVLAEPKQFGVWKQITVIEMDHVPRHTDSGWTLLAFVTDDFVTEKHEQIQEKDPQYGNIRNTTKILYFPGKRVRALVGRNDESELSILREEMRSLRSEREDESRRLQASEKISNEAKRHAEQSAARNDKLEDDFKTVTKEKKKIEEDLAKVRQAIGSLKLKEILA